MGKENAVCAGRQLEKNLGEGKLKLYVQKCRCLVGGWRVSQILTISFFVPLPHACFILGSLLRDNSANRAVNKEPEVLGTANGGTGSQSQFTRISQTLVA